MEKVTGRRDQAALVTGASGGIGRELARILWERGYELFISGRNEGELATLREELSSRAVHVVPADLELPPDRRRLCGRLQRAGLPVTVLVNNAGFGDLAPFVESSLPRQLAMIQVNVSAVVELTHSLAPLMADAGRGYILNVASTAGFAPGGLMSVYYATKAFVVSFSLALSAELASTGVNVCALCPGPTRTGFDRTAGAGERRSSRGVMNASAVAKAGIEGLFAGRRLVVPGLANKLAVQAIRFLPRPAAARYLLGFNARKTK